MTNRGFEIPKWKVILSFPRWMDERGHNDEAPSRVRHRGLGLANSEEQGSGHGALQVWRLESCDSHCVLFHPSTEGMKG